MQHDSAVAVRGRFPAARRRGRICVGGRSIGAKARHGCVTDALESILLSAKPGPVAFFGYSGISDAAAALFSQRESQMLVALSRFTIANGMADEVRAAFRGRPRLVDCAPGFLGMEVMSPVGDTAEIWLVTRWCDEISYRNWHHGHDYHESHKGIPKGLKLVPKSTEIRLFDVFSN